MVILAWKSPNIRCIYTILANPMNEAMTATDWMAFAMPCYVYPCLHSTAALSATASSGLTAACDE